MQEKDKVVQLTETLDTQVLSGIDFEGTNELDITAVQCPILEHKDAGMELGRFLFKHGIKAFYLVDDTGVVLYGKIFVPGMRVNETLDIALRNMSIISEHKADQTQNGGIVVSCTFEQYQALHKLVSLADVESQLAESERKYANERAMRHAFFAILAYSALLPSEYKAIGAVLGIIELTIMNGTKKQRLAGALGFQVVLAGVYLVDHLVDDMTLKVIGVASVAALYIALGGRALNAECLKDPTSQYAL